MKHLENFFGKIAGLIFRVLCVLIVYVGFRPKVIYANPEKNISVGVSGTFKPRIFDRIKFIEKYILPLVSE